MGETVSVQPSVYVHAGMDLYVCIYVQTDQGQRAVCASTTTCTPGASTQLYTHVCFCVHVDVSNRQTGVKEYSKQECVWVCVGGLFSVFKAS